MWRLTPPATSCSSAFRLLVCETMHDAWYSLFLSSISPFLFLFFIFFFLHYFTLLSLWSLTKTHCQRTPDCGRLSSLNTHLLHQTSLHTVIKFIEVRQLKFAIVRCDIYVWVKNKDTYHYFQKWYVCWLRLILLKNLLYCFWWKKSSLAFFKTFFWQDSNQGLLKK